MQQQLQTQLNFDSPSYTRAQGRRKRQTGGHDDDEEYLELSEEAQAAIEHVTQGFTITKQKQIAGLINYIPCLKAEGIKKVMAFVKENTSPSTKKKTQPPASNQRAKKVLTKRQQQLTSAARKSKKDEECSQDSSISDNSSFSASSKRTDYAASHKLNATEFEPDVFLGRYNILPPKMKNFIKKKFADSVLADPQEFFESMEQYLETLIPDLSKAVLKKDEVLLKRTLGEQTPHSVIILLLMLIRAHPECVGDLEIINQLKIHLNSPKEQMLFLLNLPEAFAQAARNVLSTLAIRLQSNPNEAPLGFFILALRYGQDEPLRQLLKTSPANSQYLEALEGFGISLEVVNHIKSTKNNRPFLYYNVVAFLKQLFKSEQLGIAQIISKLLVAQAPSANDLTTLRECLNNSQVLQDALIAVPTINLAPSILVAVIENLKSLEQDQTKQFFEDCQDPQKWFTESVKIASSTSYGENQHLSEDQVIELFTEFMQGAPNPLNFDYVKELDRLGVLHFAQYKSCLYQAMIATVMIAHSSKYAPVLSLPTGSGKSWIQLLFSLHFYEKEACLIIVPSNTLADQMNQQRGTYDGDLTIISTTEYDATIHMQPVVLIDEADGEFEERPYEVVQTSNGISNLKISGLWNLSTRKYLAFISATISSNLPKLITQVIRDSKALSFKSEYELVSKEDFLQSIQPTIEYHPQEDTLLLKLRDLILLHHTSQPLIIFLEFQTQIDELIKLCSEYGISTYQLSTLGLIRHKQQGVLFLLSSTYRGLDTRFQKKDALVIIACVVKSFSHLYQMIGRGNRSRCPPRSILLTSKYQGSPQLLQSLSTMNQQLIPQLTKLLVLLKGISAWESFHAQKVLQTLLIFQKKATPLMDIASLITQLKQSSYTSTIAYVQKKISESQQVA